MQLFEQPVLFPLSHFQLPPYTPSPHLIQQFELDHMVPLQVYPGVTLQLESQPALPPLSHYSVPIRIPSPQTSLH